MRDRYLSLVATIATSALIACGDAAVDNVTAPVPAAKPAQPVANQWPTESEYAENGIPSAIGITIAPQASFQDDFTWFVATGNIHFEWVNDVSASVTAWLINKNGTTVNTGYAAIQYSRLALPVPEGDTVMTVRISTNGIKCGLIGKSSFSGHAAQKAIDVRLVQITLYSQTIGPTTGPDIVQPECPPEAPPPPPPVCETTPVARVLAGTAGILASESETCTTAPAPPPSGGGDDDDFEICYTVWLELWIWDFFSNSFTLAEEWIVGFFCIVYTQ
jgi:hypothetical protein